MKSIELVCPHCNAQLTLNKEEKMVFCNYCGAMFAYDDGVKRSEHTQNINKTYTDSAALVEAEAKKIQAEANAKVIVESFRLKAFLVVAGIIAVFLIVFFAKNYLSDYIEANRVVYIAIPSSSASYEKYDNYLDVVSELENLGFTNVIAAKGEYEIPFLNVMATPGEVVDVAINGNRIESGKEYPQNSRIVVTYYSND